MKFLTALVNLPIVVVRSSMVLLLRRLVVSSLMVALIVSNVPLFAAPALAGQAATGLISGTARNAAGQSMPGTTVRLRNVQTGQLAGSTTSSASGQFSFAALDPGNYVVEMVNAAGQVVGTSAAISLAPAAMVATGVGVTASAATAAAAAAAAGGASFFATTAGIITVAAVGAGVAGAVVAVQTSNASPSQ